MRQFYNGNIELVNVIKKGGKKKQLRNNSQKIVINIVFLFN